MALSWRRSSAFGKTVFCLMPLGEMQGIGPGSRVVMKGHVASVPVGPQMLGRILDGLGHPLDGLPPVRAEARVPLYAAPLNPLHRARITQPVDLGIRAINALLTCGQGQKIGVFAGSGVGKSGPLRHDQSIHAG